MPTATDNRNRQIAAHGTNSHKTIFSECPCAAENAGLSSSAMAVQVAASQVVQAAQRI